MSRLRFAPLAIALAVAWSGWADAQAGQLDREAFKQDIQSLTRHPHRLAGFGRQVDGGQTDLPGSYSASKHVESRLRQMGFAENDEQQTLFVQEFPIVQPTTTECELIIDGQTYRRDNGFHVARPCMLQASISPAEGLTGEVVYGGTGDMSDVSGSLAGKIVFLEYDCGKEWINAFAFGAKAVVFIGQEFDPNARTVNPYHHINMPANLPRFYITPELAKQLNIRGRRGEVTIKAAARWGTRRGRNVIAIIRGRNPRFGEDEKRAPEAVLLAAPLDSLSEAPELSPGARDAANVAGLLQVAAYLLDDRPRRDVILCFFDAQANNHAGAKAFYGALNRGWNTIGADFQLEELRHMLQEERAHHGKMLEVMAKDDLFSNEAKRYKKHADTIRLLRTEAKNFASEILDVLSPMRVKRSDLQRKYDLAADEAQALAGSDTPDSEKLVELEAKLQELAEKIAELDKLIGVAGVGGLAKEDMDWNQVEKYLYEGRTAEQALAEINQTKSDESRQRELAKYRAIRDKLSRLIAHTEKLIHRRLDEIAQEFTEVQQCIALRDRIGDGVRHIVLHVSFNLGDARGRWTFIHGDDSAALNQDKGGNYTGIFNTMRQVHVQLNGWQTLSSRDIKNWPAFAAAMVAGASQEANKPAARAWALLRPDIKELVRQSAQSGPGDVSEAVKSRITRAFNDVIKNRDFWRRSDLLGTDLSEQDRMLLQKQDRTQLPQEDIQRLNRLVLEQTYGEFLPVSPAVRQAPHFDRSAISGLFDIHHFAPGMFADSGAAARLFAVFNVSVMTAMDPLIRQGHPFDNVESLDSDVILAQLSEISPFIKSLADHENMSVINSIRPDGRYHDAEWSGSKSTGGSVKRAGGGSAMADRPVPDALVVILPNVRDIGIWRSAGLAEVPPGFIYGTYVKTNMHGTFSTPPSSQLDHKRCAFFAVTFDKDKTITDPATGQEVLLPSRGLIDFVVNKEKFAAKREAAAAFRKASIALFKTRIMTAVGYGYDRGSLATIAMRAASTAPFRSDRHLLCEYENILTLFAPHDARGYKLFNKGGMALLNNTEQEYSGMGLSLADPFEHPVTADRTSHDLVVLNGGRLDLMRTNHINAESLEILNSKAKDIREDSALIQSPRTRNDGLAAAASTARRPYIRLVDQIKDLVTAVVVLLLLAMPFAYSLERLLIGTPHIYRQIGWFTLFFVVTFTILYFVNPAFQIAATPIIIFLAFGIILLSSLVIFIMTRKLQTEIKKMQGLSATVHSADVSRLSTMMAAVHMGISTMRRRPLRTLLTATTVVLLTFTILTFASFGTSWGNRRTYEAPLDGPARILVRHQLWNPIGDGVFKMIRGYLLDEAEVVPRYWISPTASQIKEASTKTDENFERLVSSDKGDYIAPVAAAIGLDKRDVDLQPEIRALFKGRTDLLETDGIFLTNAVAQQLRLTDADIGKAHVLYAGHRLTYAGRVTDELAGFEMLEASSMLPVDYHSSSGGSVEGFAQDTAVTTETLSEMPDIESAQFVTYNLDMNVIIPAKLAHRLGGGVRSITVYPRELENIQDLAERLARISELPTYVGDANGVYRLIFTSLAKASGVKDLLIPVCLGGLIIFATMLGSVSDREREIYTFSSLGLAPPHVASLFFAEASVYAVLGGMGGYLLGQVIARVVGLLSRMGYVSAIEMNYSSTNAIVTILIVMCTVMVSTIYPAAKASRSANPGIQRSWRIPKPEGDLYDLMFPFTVSAYDITGVVSFLKEHFDNYSDTSLGVFASIESHVFRQSDNDMLGFRAQVALAPFDLGVTQNFAMLSQPSEIEGIDEVRILIFRTSGARGDWQRANRVFVNELRKQLLIWRAITPQIMDRYRQGTLAKWDSLPKEQVDSQTIAGGSA